MTILSQVEFKHEVTNNYNTGLLGKAMFETWKYNTRNVLSENTDIKVTNMYDIDIQLDNTCTRAGLGEYMMFIASLTYYQKKHERIYGISA